MRQDEIKKLLEVGVLLSAERDINRLLEKILGCVMDLSRCDAGTLYLRDGDTLRFRIMCNHILKTYSGGDGREPDLPPVPLTRESVCALAVLENKTIRIEDVRQCEEYDLTGPIRYDAMTGYHSQSMLVVPMRNREGEILGVLQLINAMDEAGAVQAFPEDMALVLESVASQAAITIQNVRYIREIKDLFQSFVRVMSSAVDERTPYNGSHTRHMAQYGARLIDFLNDHGIQPPFSPAQTVGAKADGIMREKSKEDKYGKSTMVPPPADAGWAVGRADVHVVRSAGPGSRRNRQNSTADENGGHRLHHQQQREEHIPAGQYAPLQRLCD